MCYVADDESAASGAALPSILPVFFSPDGHMLSSDCEVCSVYYELGISSLTSTLKKNTHQKDDSCCGIACEEFVLVAREHVVDQVLRCLHSPLFSLVLSLLCSP